MLILNSKNEILADTSLPTDKTEATVLIRHKSLSSVGQKILSSTRPFPADTISAPLGVAKERNDAIRAAEIGRDYMIRLGQKILEEYCVSRHNPNFYIDRVGNNCTPSRFGKFIQNLDLGNNLMVQSDALFSPTEAKPLHFCTGIFRHVNLAMNAAQNGLSILNISFNSPYRPETTIAVTILGVPAIDALDRLSIRVNANRDKLVDIPLGNFLYNALAGHQTFFLQLGLTSYKTIYSA